MLLSVKNVTKRFGGLVAVNDVSVDVENGEILGIIGPNGAGKTTLLNCISGYYAPEEGEIIYKGVCKVQHGKEQNIAGIAPEKLCSIGIGRTFQIVRAFKKMTALENVKVAVIFGMGKRHEADRIAKELLDYVEFPVSYDTRADDLNNVQQKRLELARALATGCELLLLDEVASGLTPSELPDFIALIKRIRDDGKTVICIEHVMKFIMDICDNIIVLNFGKKIAEGPPEVIKQDERVMEAYFGEEEVH